MFRVSIWGLGVLFGETKPPKPPRGDGSDTRYESNVGRIAIANCVHFL